MRKWTVLSSTYPFSCPWLRVRKDVVRLPSDVEIPDLYVGELPDWVNIIAITNEGDFLIEEQYRHGIGRVCFELCAGIIEKGESPLESAKRELLEETGYVSDEWMAYGECSPNASGCNNCCYTFIATNIQRIADPQLEKTEDIAIHLFNEKQLKEVMLDGRMTEADMLAPLWRYFANK